MEMATQTKTKAKSKTKKRATKNVQATVRTATGNGNLYTQNICTIKEQEIENRITSFKGSTKKFATDKQNTKSEIKFSHYKSKRNHLKILISLSIKFILCLSQVNKSIFKILTIKTNTYYKYKCNNSENCIINLRQQDQQKLQKKAQCFKIISFKFQIVKNFLNKYNIKSKIIINEIRYFAGICLKRLISLKRLQQIPESHANLNKESLLSIQIKITSYKFVNFTKKTNQNDELKHKFIKANTLCSKNCQLYKESLKALKSLQRKPKTKILKEIKNHKNCPECLKKNYQAFSQVFYYIQQWHKNLNLEQTKCYRKLDLESRSCSLKQCKLEQQHFFKKYISIQDHTLKDPLRTVQQQNFFKVQFKVIKKYHQTKAESNPLRPNNLKLLTLLSNCAKKCSQLNKQRITFEFITTNKDKIKALKTRSIKICNLKIHHLLDPCYGMGYLIVVYIISQSQEILNYCKEFKNIKIPQFLLYSGHNFYQHTTNYRSALEQSCGKIPKVEVNSQLEYNKSKECDKENKTKFINNFFQQCGQLIKFNNFIKNYIAKLYQISVCLASKLRPAKSCEKQKDKKNALKKYDSLKKYRFSQEKIMKTEQRFVYGYEPLFYWENKKPVNLQRPIKNSEECSELKRTRVVFENGYSKFHSLKLQEYLNLSSDNCLQVNKKRILLKKYFYDVHKIRHEFKCYLKNATMTNAPIIVKKCRVAPKDKIKLGPAIEIFIYGHMQKYDNDLQFNQNNYILVSIFLKNRVHFKQNNKTLEQENYRHITAPYKNYNNFCKSPSKQHQQIHKNSSNKNGFRKQIIQSFINKAEEMELLKYANIASHLQLHDSNNFYQLKSQHKKFLKRCQYILYSILFYCCCICYWHIYGFPLVLRKIFKHLKGATVHVLTQRFKIPKTSTTKIATSIYYGHGNIKVACEGKLKKPTKDNKNNQQNILKEQKQAIGKETKLTTTFTACAYSSSCCLTTSLTVSSASSISSYYKSLENLILLPNKAQQLRQPCCHYQQYNHYKYHHHLHYQHNRQKQETPQSQHQQQQQQQQQKQKQQKEQKQKQHYKSYSIFHLRLPSLLVFSRTLIILILLSSLWHTSEGFHGSGVKLSTNTVKTKYGLVRGIVVRSSPSLVEAYLGIPYASPPVGSLRFMPPITPSTWKNVRNADRFSPVCPQNVPIPPNGPEALLEVPRARLAQLRRLLPLLSNQSEDCLYLNIYVPYENRRLRRFTTHSGELNDKSKLSTILFIHGESYEWNSGNPYDGSELAAHGNVIVVTINFRLGILGFLKTGGKESAQGNFGLMDLVAGLHWLKENLPAFGGDPQQITLLGHGTGAALANILVVSPVASDLVQHTIMVSGSALSPWAIQKNPLFVKRRVAEQTGCHGDMLYYDLAPCLRTKTVAELLAVKIDHPRFLVGFAPFIDGTVISPNTDSIGKLSLPLGSAIVSTSGIEYANFPKRNLIFCLTSVESHLDLSAQDLEFGFNETRRDRILRTYVRNNFHYHLNEIFAVLKNEYTEWDKAIRSPLSSRDATLQFLSDGHTASSLIKLGFMHSLRGGRGYFLHFKHRTLEEEYPQRTGSVRGEDVPFWLGLPISPLFPHNYTTQERQISRLMLRYLANFAKTGNPNQSSLPSPLPSSSSLISSASLSSPLSSTASVSRQAANDSHEKIKRSSFNIVNDTSLTSSGPNMVEDVATAAAREALNLAVLYNQRRTKRTFYKRHSRSNNDDHSGSASSEVNYFLSTNNNINKLNSDEMPFWDAYDIVNQLYMELGNKAEIQSHYRGHKLSMWLNLIPQLHRHANMNDQSMRHHQFQDDLNNLNLYEGIVRAQMQTKPDDDDENLLLPKGRLTPPPPAQELNMTQKSQGGTTECGVDGAMFVAEMTTLPPSDNHSLVLDSREKEMATASTGLIGNLEVLRRLSGKQFQSYTTALVATVAVGCFLLILNILIFAGIYHQREKRARDAKTKEELQDNDTSKNSSTLKLNAIGSETGSFNGNVAGVSGKTTVVFGEYSCYDEKSLHSKDEKLIVELPPKQIIDANWAACSTSTLDLLKTKHHTPIDTTYTLSNVVPISTESQTEHLIGVNNLEMATYSPLPVASGLIIDPPFTATSSSGLLSKRGSFVGSSGQLNQYDFASVQSSDQMSFKDIENAVKASSAMNDNITHDDDIPEPPPPPRSFQSMQQQQQQSAANVPTSTSASSGGGGILRQAGTTSATQTGGGKKRVHIQEISV